MDRKLFRASLLLAAFALPTRAQLVIQAPSPIALRAGEGGGIVTLSVGLRGAPNTALTLVCGPIIDTATNGIVKGATVILGPIVDISTHSVVPGSAPSSGPIADDTTHTTIRVGAALPALCGGGAKLPSSIGPGDMFTLMATVKGISGTSEVKIPIFNGVEQIGTLIAFASDAALNIAIDGDGATADKTLAYTYGNPVVIGLKNGDAQSYHVHWDFQIDNRSESFSDLDVPLSGSSRITINPTSRPFSVLDWIHPSSKKGVLLLSFKGPANVPDSLLPSRTLPISLVMQRHSPFWSSVWSYSYVGVLLLIGGIFSFLGSSTLPNVQTKGELRARLQDIANRTSTVSTLIDSYLRVLLRLERSSIKDVIKNEPSWIPASVEPLILAAVSIDNLSTRLAAAERLDDLRRKHDQISSTAPPSITDGIDANLQDAADQLHSAALSETVVAAANGFFAKAQAALDMLDDTDALAKQIAGNVAIAMTRVEKFPVDYADLKASLPGIFVFADRARGYDKAESIVRPMLFAIDHGVAAIQIALDYAMVRASIPVLPTNSIEAERAAPANAGIETVADAALQCHPRWVITRQRLLERHCVLIALLGTLSWRALRDATLLVQEMREDTYVEDVLDEISVQGQAEIVIDTQSARQFQPVFFSIKFKDSRFNDAAALQRLLCRWTFPGNLHESTWKVCHYFKGDEQATIPPFEWKQTLPPQFDTGAALDDSNQPTDASGKRPHSFRGSNQHVSIDVYVTIRGQQLDEARQVPMPPLKKTIQIRPAPRRDWSRLAAEAFRFAIAFGVALAALLSGALNQLQKLDIIPASIAIIGLGFSASAIKNLLTQSNTLQTPAATSNPVTSKS